MKKLVLALTALAAFTGSAVAADLPARTYKAPPPPAPVYNWTGLWISGGFGYGLMDVDHSVTASTAPFALFDPAHDTGGRGWLGKVGAGYDYQFAGPFGNWVIGAFADGQWSDIKGQNSFFCPNNCLGPLQSTGQIKNDWSWSVGGRIGYVALPGLLTYVNGGFTEANFTQVNYFNADPGDVGFGTRTGLVRPSLKRDGWFIGGGTEYAITQLPGLFWKSEYRFSDFGNKTDAQLCTVTNTVTGCGVAGTVHSLDRNHTFEQTATTELVYRFNWGGPLVAKY
jgi:outer membrane immunogenic protein